jgi:hypothetical protein
MQYFIVLIYFIVLSQSIHHRPLVLSELQKERVRVALMQVAGGASSAQAVHLETFASWLDEPGRPEYDLVVDGANVAYNRQNFENGRFSFRQIEMVVDALYKRFGPDVRILVLVPYPYAQKAVPNRTKQRSGRRIR